MALQVPLEYLVTLGTFWIPWTFKYIFDTLDLKVPFGYHGSLGTFWILWTLMYLLDNLKDGGGPSYYTTHRLNRLRGWSSENYGAALFHRLCFAKSKSNADFAPQNLRDIVSVTLKFI